MEPEERVNILLVDDQPEGLVTLEAVLESLGQNLVKARSGRDALRHLLALEFAVILLDVQMPEMDGYEVATLIRERTSSRQTPIIFLTATHRAEVQIIRGYAVGAVDYLFKPLNPDVLRSKVSVFVELAKKSALIRKQTTALIQKEQEALKLADTRAQLLAELEQKNRALEGANRELETFSYSVSHDLRGPLRSLDGFSQVLLDDYGDALNQAGQDYLRRIRAAAQRMGHLIDDLLSLSRVTRADLTVAPIDLTALARKVIADLPPQAAGRPVAWEVGDPLTAHGDASLVRIVLDNLLGNAHKFTGNCERPRIEFGEAVQGADQVFFVRDNGVGFDMAYSKRLFGAFQRLHTPQEFPGTGIGLATVQRIIHRHGGRVWAEAQLGKGATFFFTLPASG